MLMLVVTTVAAYEVTLVRGSVQADINGDGHMDAIKAMERRDVAEVDGVLAETVTKTWVQLYDGGCACEAVLWLSDTSEMSDMSLVEHDGETYLAYEAQAEGGARAWYWRRLEDYESDTWVQATAPTGAEHCPGVEVDGWCFEGESDTPPLEGCPIENDVVDSACFANPSFSWVHQGAPVTVEIRVWLDDGVYEWSTLLDAELTCDTAEVDPRIEYMLCDGYATAWYSPMANSDPSLRIQGSFWTQAFQGGAPVSHLADKAYYR